MILALLKKQKRMNEGTELNDCKRRQLWNMLDGILTIKESYVEKYIITACGYRV